MAPAVDSIILPAMLSTMQDVDTVRRVPIMYGWTVHDGAYFVDMDVTINKGDYGMTSEEYDTFWSRFRGTGTEAERTANGFDESNFEKQGKKTAAFMAAADVVTTSMYSCGVYSMITADGVNPDMYAYIFDDRKRENTNKLVHHGDELDYMLQIKAKNKFLHSDVRTMWTNFAKY
jgi:carboxylesterase type B